MGSYLGAQAGPLRPQLLQLSCHTARGDSGRRPPLRAATSLILQPSHPTGMAGWTLAEDVRVSGNPQTPHPADAAAISISQGPARPPHGSTSSQHRGADFRARQVIQWHRLSRST